MIYVCSDLHGYPLEKFKLLLNSVGFCNSDFLYVLGDVIDRGNEGVRLLQWMMLQPNVQLILGNHEAMMLACDFLSEEITENSISMLTESKLAVYTQWLSNDAQSTLDELSKLNKDDIEYILEYLKDSPLYEVLTVNNKDFLLTHSGLDNFDVSKKLSEYEANDFLWNRPNESTKYFDNIFCIFGHTPTKYFGDKYEGRVYKTNTWIDIDIGAGFGLTPMLLRLDDMQEFYLN